LEWMQTAMKLREVEHRSFDDDFFIQGVCEWTGGDG
jgi:hypothetical protein